MDAAELREEVIRLGPWHLDVEITPEVSTRAFLDAPPGTYPDSLGKVTFHEPREGFLRRLGRMFPGGLEGRSVLDCASNCGGYLFFAKEAGAGRSFGFDVREHWIRQARFLAEHRVAPTDDMRFEVMDLYDLRDRDIGRFDVTLFLGIFYHLPDPIGGLKLAADRTDELLVLNTATKAGRPDGLLVAEDESETKAMSGTYGLCWFPTGPAVLMRILAWLGFPEVRCSVWRHAPRQRDDLDRVEVLAARTPGFFSDWDAAVSGDARVKEMLETRAAPGAKVLVLGEEERLGEVQGREVVALPPAGGRALERLRDGARYVALLPEAAPTPDLEELLAERASVVVDERECRLYELAPQG